MAVTDHWSVMIDKSDGDDFHTWITIGSVSTEDSVFVWQYKKSLSTRHRRAHSPFIKLHGFLENTKVWKFAEESAVWLRISNSLREDQKGKKRQHLTSSFLSSEIAVQSWQLQFQGLNSFMCKVIGLIIPVPGSFMYQLLDSFTYQVLAQEYFSRIRFKNTEDGAALVVQY